MSQTEGKKKIVMRGKCYEKSQKERCVSMYRQVRNK